MGGLDEALRILDYGSDEGPWDDEAAAVRALVAERDLLRGVVEDLVDCQYEFPIDTDPDVPGWRAAFGRAKEALRDSC